MKPAYPTDASSRPMNVAYVTMRFPAASETFATTDVRTLRRAGVDVAVYTMRAPLGDANALLHERQLAGLRVSHGTFRADLRGLVCCLGRPFLTVGLISWLVRRTWRKPLQLLTSLVLAPRSVGIFADLERERPDVVHLFWGHYPCIVGYLVLTRLPHTVLSVFLGAYDLARAYGGTPWVAHRADLVWTHAKCNIRMISALGVPADRLQVAYRGTDPALFSRPRPPQITHRIVSAGRLIPEKGMDDVLLVFREVHSRWPGATLTILGDGPERASLEQLSRSLGIERAVTFRGHLTQEETVSEMAAAEVFLLMSRKESERLPNVVKEAMASRCLCVVADTPGIDELIGDGQHGFVVPRRSVQMAAARVEAVFSRRVNVNSMVDAASSRIRRDFDVAAAMSCYRRGWQHALTTRGITAGLPVVAS